MSGTLFVVGTPIGNLGDMTPRARETLARVAMVAAEDTRRTGRLLGGLDIRKPMLSFFEGNERERVGQILLRLRTGDDVALVTDGGMPGVSDPGFRLVRAAAAEGIDVRVIPGPSAAIAALVVSGLPTDRFVFEGFLPKKEGERMRRLDGLAEDPRTIVCFESPARLPAMLRDLLTAMGDRQVAVARELTKLHEEVLRGRASEVLAGLAGVDLKGEVAVVIAGSPPTASDDVAVFIPEAEALIGSGMRKRDAAHEVAERYGVSANALYRALLDDRPSPQDEPPLN
ncbi:MAG: 16S rRNA (cytidine(1402)-2'-O)-methyltransferase [Actinomycetota bacterium]|nr:16S rRNA (cytidine(1402)-2'-O)-methyltransferase [Actinomycetota bacterium]